MIKNLLRAAAVAAVMSPALFAQSFCWTESVDNVTITPGIGIACAYNGTLYTADNQYWRRYNPLARGQTANFNVTSLTFGIEIATAGLAATTQPGTLKVFRDTTPGNPAPKASLIPLGSEAINIPNTTQGTFSFTFTTPIACNSNGGDDIVICLEIPDGNAAQNKFFWGGNASGEATPTYISSTACGLPEPTPYSQIGFPANDMIFDLCGTSTSTAPVTYCTAKITSVPCTPAMGFTGTSSASATSGFAVKCTQVINNKSGLLFYGNTGRAATPFQGGTLCVKTPIKRTPAQSSGGNPPPNDCSGNYSIDMNSFASGGLGGSPAPFLLVVSTVVDTQWWGRDPGFAAPNNTMLSNGLEYIVGP
jgi:hypothetical protein